MVRTGVFGSGSIRISVISIEVKYKSPLEVLLMSGRIGLGWVNLGSGQNWLPCFGCHFEYGSDLYGEVVQIQHLKSKSSFQ